MNKFFTQRHCPSILFLYLVFIYITISCSKKEVEYTEPIYSEPVYSASIVGTWLWLQSFGGLSGDIITPTDVNYNKTLYITTDSLFFYKRNFNSLLDSLEYKSPYILSRAYSIFDNDTIDVLDVNGNIGGYSLFKDSLSTFSINVTDGGESFYVRK